MSEEVARRVNGLRAYSLTLAAGASKRLIVSGDWIQIVVAPVDDLMVRFDDSQKVQMYAGQGVRTYYSTVELESATGQTVTVWLGYGHATDSRATANVNVSTTVAPGNTLNNGGDVSLTSGAATQILAADTDRLYATISNGSSNTVTVRIGNASVVGTTGIPLEPGETISVGTTAAIYGFQASGGAVTISAATVSEV